MNSHNGEELRGYHKPIMLAGGIGNVRDHVQKRRRNQRRCEAGRSGGPAINIGLQVVVQRLLASGQSDAGRLTYFRPARRPGNGASLPEKVMDHYWQLGDADPILFIHDVGAGGVFLTRCRSW
ncbi:hypothetical protein ACLB1E_14830 [Escherichia coli]